MNSSVVHYGEGSVPIAKNITVVDESGKVHEPTYYKRARGLVKTGRARYVDSGTICLTNPPVDKIKKPEENTMEQFDGNGNEYRANDNGPRPETPAEAGTEGGTTDMFSPEYAKYLLEKMATFRPGQVDMNVLNYYQKIINTVLSGQGRKEEMSEREFKLRALEIISENRPDDDDTYADIVKSIMSQK